MIRHIRMDHVGAFIFGIAVALFVFPLLGVSFAARGFDEFGYNDNARIFSGIADGVDRKIDGKIWGSPDYASDRLVMKWNAEWDRGNDEGWDDPNGYNASLNNEWNGKVRGGSGEVWIYKIKWIGACGSDSTPTGDGGYCIWGQFEVVMSQGTVANQHFWDAHAIPAGYGKQRP